MPLLAASRMFRQLALINPLLYPPPTTSRIPNVPSRHLNIFLLSLLFVSSVRVKSTSIFLEEISETFVINSLILHRRYNPSKACPVSPVILLNVRDSLVMLCNPNTRFSLLLNHNIFNLVLLLKNNYY